MATPRLFQPGSDVVGWDVDSMEHRTRQYEAPSADDDYSLEPGETGTDTGIPDWASEFVAAEQDLERRSPIPLWGWAVGFWVLKKMFFGGKKGRR